MAFPLLLLGGGAAVAVVAKSSVAPSQTAIASTTAAVQQNPTRGNGFNPGATITQILGGLSPAPGSPPPKATNLAAARLHIVGGRLGAAIGVSSPIPTSSVQQQAQDLVKQKLDAVNNYMSQTYDQLSKEAKEKGAKALNDALHLDPPVSADSSYEEIASAAGGAVGAAAGAYIGGPLGAKIGAIVGAYLGVQLEEFLNKNLDDIGNWFKSKWNDIENWVEDEAGSVASSVSNWVGSLF